MEVYFKTVFMVFILASAGSAQDSCGELRTRLSQLEARRTELNDRAAQLGVELQESALRSPEHEAKMEEMNSIASQTSVLRGQLDATDNQIKVICRNSR